MTFPNYAGCDDVDELLTQELTLANIPIERAPECMRQYSGEVKTIIIGNMFRWSFKRAWYYWVCKGPGLPHDLAMELHAAHGRTVRVDGHCGCPSPHEQFQGLGCGLYHVDDQEGLNLLADTIRKCVARHENQLPGS